MSPHDNWPSRGRTCDDCGVPLPPGNARLCPDCDTADPIEDEHEIRVSESCPWCGGSGGGDEPALFCRYCRGTGVQRHVYYDEED